MMISEQDLFETVAKQIVAAMQATTFSIAFPGAQMGRIDQMDPSRKRRRHRKRFALAAGQGHRGINRVWTIQSNQLAACRVRLAQERSPLPERPMLVGKATNLTEGTEAKHIRQDPTQQIQRVAQAARAHKRLVGSGLLAHLVT